MLDVLHMVTTDSTNPYANLALEEALLNAVAPNECILYLWQNRNTVVIGRNQNSRRECRVETLERDGGFLARRLSGGGAVFHDLGNLNFTFLVRKEAYDVGLQLEVILRAVQALGVRAEKTGRNDLTVDGRKFSGNAFYSSGGYCYHHGTILIDVDREQMSKYLSVPADKLKAKGVQSVKSRVVNLTELVPGITVNQVKGALTAAFGEVYGGTPSPYPMDTLDARELRRLTEKFASWEWRVGRETDFTYETSRRFAWGGVELKFCVSGGLVREAAVYTDAMDVPFAQRVRDAWTGIPFARGTLSAAVEALPTENEEQAQMSRDIRALLEELV